MELVVSTYRLIKVAGKVISAACSGLIHLPQAGNTRVMKAALSSAVLAMGIHAAPALAVAPANPVCDGVPTCLAGIFYTGQTSGGVTTDDTGSLQHYSYTFTADQTTLVPTFMFRQDPAGIDFGHVVLVDNTAANSVNLLVNGDFASILPSGMPAVWSHVGTDNGTGISDGMWSDGIVGSFDGLAQKVTSIVGHSYTLTFDLQNSGAWNGVSASTLLPSDGDFTEFFAFTQLPAGIPVTGGNLAPTASGLLTGGGLYVGGTLTGSYTYNSTSSEGVSTFQWYSSNDTNFANASSIYGATALTYTPVNADGGKYLFFCVSPVSADGITGDQSCSSATAAIPAPRANSVAITGTPQAGTQLTGSYTYSFPSSESTSEGATTFQWYASNNTNVANGSPIGGATALTYTPVNADGGKYLFFCVTPVDTAGVNGPQSCASTAETVISDLAIVNPTAGQNSVMGATSKVSFGVNHAMSSGTIVFTRTGGAADRGSPHTCTLENTKMSGGDVGLVAGNGCTSDITLVNGAIYTIDFAGIDSNSRPGSASITGVTYDTSLPTVASSSPITANKGEGNSGAGYEAGDTITLNFSEPVSIARLTMAIATGMGAGVSNTHSLGSSPGVGSVDSVDGYTSSLRVALGSGTTLAANDVLTIGSWSVYDQGENYASGSLSFTIPSTFAPNVPGQPSIGTATPGDGRLSVAFTPPVSNGGGTITQYQVLCMPTAFMDDRINRFAAAPSIVTATGSGSPIVVSGLNNGTEYACEVKAQNSAGYGFYSYYSNGATPVAAEVVDTPDPTPSAPPNPFNPAGNSTGSEVEVHDNSGTTYTHATNSLISNLGNLDNKVGVSDNGVVVINASTSVPVQISDNAPDNVLFSLPTTQGVDMHIGGQGINVTTNTDPVKDSNGKTVSTVLATKTVTNEQGQSVQTVLVVTGQAQVQSSSPNQIVGGLNLSTGDSQRDVTVTGGSTGSTAGFAKNSSDQSGAVSAESGEITVFIKLHKTTTVTAGNKLSTGFAADSSDSSTLTLQAGEVARFNGNGDLLGVFLGSLSGSLGKLGDRLATQTPTGLTGWPSTVPDLIGNNSPARLGGNFASAMFAAATGSSLVQDKSNGTVTISLADNRVLYALPLGDLSVDSSKADGIVTANDGSLELTAKGVTSRFIPVLADASGFASAMQQTYGLNVQLKDNGSLNVSGSNGISYLLLPRFEATASSQAAGLGWSADSKRLSYVSAQGAQVLDPLAYDFAQLSGLVTALGQGWALQRNSDGSLSISGPAQQQYSLLPDYAVQLPSAEVQGKSAGTAWMGNDGKLYLLYNTGFLPMVQGFSVQ